jgi:acyl carrier protein
MEPIYSIISDCLTRIKNENNLSFTISPSLELIGKNSELDSMSLVTLILDIEEKINAKYNILITLANEKAMSSNNSPFKTVDTLTNYIKTLLQANKE